MVPHTGHADEVNMLTEYVAFDIIITITISTQLCDSKIQKCHCQYERGFELLHE